MVNVSIVEPSASASKFASPVAEVADLRCPILLIDEDTLKLGDYPYPARPGDLLRVHVQPPEGRPRVGPLLVAVTGVDTVAAELDCRVKQAPQEGRDLLRYWQDILPNNHSGPRPYPSLSNRLLRPQFRNKIVALIRRGKRRRSPLLFLGLGGVIGLVLVRSLYTSISTITIEKGVVAIPPGPLESSVDPVVARESGLINQLYVREGMGVAPGQPLFSTRPDPAVDFDLQDRSAARDLISLDAQMRDTQGELDSLAEQIALNSLEGTTLPESYAQLQILNKQLKIARLQRQRREGLMRQGVISQDNYEVIVDRVLDLEARQQQVLRQYKSDQARRDRGAVLTALETLHRQRWTALLQRRQHIQHGVDERLALRRQHPLPTFLVKDQQPLQNEIYRASSSAVVLRQLKQIGDAVQAKEAVFVLQQKRLPPTVEAKASGSQVDLLALGSTGMADIPAIGQHYAVRLSGIGPRRDNGVDLKVEFLNLQANDVRQIIAVQGKTVKLTFPSKLNLLERMSRFVAAGAS